MSAVRLCYAVVPHMVEQGAGSIVTTQSYSVKQPIDNLVLSNSVRAAVSGLVKSLSNEYAKDNVLVTNVCPGYTLTSRLDELSEKLAKAEGVTPKQIQDRWSSQIPMRRLGQAEEFANMVVFLASERSSYITGVSIAVDGGFVKSPF